MNKIAKYISNAIERYRLKNKAFIIISNNCWGYDLYNVLGRQYNTPFVGLFLFPECYIRFLENFKTCINSEISFSKTSKYLPDTPSYPMGVLGGGIEIHFLHYSSEKEALEKWNRRIARLKEAVCSNEPIFLKFCDRDGCTTEHMSRFHSLAFENKLSIGITSFNAASHLHCPNLIDSEGNSVVDGVKLYNQRYHYFDISDWILEGKVKRSMVSRCLTLTP
jgi:uncharacterized protein (DUF1919 family)